MEGKGIYTDSYNVIEKLIKDNTTGHINIDYSKLDERTAAELRSNITKVLIKRRGEVYRTISGVQ